jgi:hypothetical protein
MLSGGSQTEIVYKRHYAIVDSVFKGPHYELNGVMDEDAAAAQSNLSNMMQEWIPN